MPESSLPKLKIENLSARRTIENILARRWLCPGDQTIAAYVDNALGRRKRTRLEAHLARCACCRQTVADVVKLQREVELPIPPFEMTRNQLRIVSPVSTRSRWLWAPAGAMALLVLTAVSISLLHKPEQLLVPSSPAPSAPAVAKAEPVNPHDATVPEILRKPQVRNALPVLLSPLEGSTVTRERLEFNWKPVARSRYYQVRVVTSNGDLLWEGRTEVSTLHLPSDVVLKDGSYFVWITAYLTDGRVSKSSPVRFFVKR